MYAKIAGAAVAAFLGVTAAANAADLYAFNPAKTSFTAAGQASVTGPAGSYACSISMAGSTERTVAKITSVTFSGASGCENVVALALPWKVRPLSYTNLQITHAGFSYPGLGHCGPNQVKGTLSQGNISILDQLPNFKGVCTISVSLTTSPALSIGAAQ